MDSIEIEPIQCLAMDFTNEVSGDVQSLELQNDALKTATDNYTCFTIKRDPSLFSLRLLGPWLQQSGRAIDSSAKTCEAVGSNPARHWTLFLSFLTFHRIKVIECPYSGPSRTCFLINCCER